MRVLGWIACASLIEPVFALLGPSWKEAKCTKTHIIHIGKTGGSSIESWLEKGYPHGGLENGRALALRPHLFKLGQGEPGDCYAFFVRDPVDRWVSGFLENLRHAKMGWPWNVFKTPNDLAEALGSANETRAREALKANNWIEHTGRTFAWYLPNLTEHLHSIAFVGETYKLEADFPRMCAAAGLPPPMQQRLKPWMRSYVPVRVNPADMEWMKEISATSMRNLRRLLDEDYRIMDRLREAGLIQSTLLTKAACLATQASCMLSRGPGRFLLVDRAGAPVREPAQLHNATDIREIVEDERQRALLMEPLPREKEAERAS